MGTGYLWEFSTIRLHLRIVILYIMKETDGDWVTMGVLYFKAPPLTSNIIY